MTNARVPGGEPPPEGHIVPPPLLQIADRLSIGCLSFTVNIYRGLKPVFGLQGGGVRGTVEFTP